MNPCVRAVVRTALYHGLECYGIRRGWNGLISGDIVKLIRKLQPQARLHVIKPYPARKREQWVLDLDAELDKQLQPDAMTDVSDPGKGLLLQDGSGNIDEKYFRDGLHPIESGYEILAKTYKKLLKRK